MSCMQNRTLQISSMEMNISDSSESDTKAFFLSNIYLTYEEGILSRTWRSYRYFHTAKIFILKISLSDNKFQTNYCQLPHISNNSLIQKIIFLYTQLKNKIFGKIFLDSGLFGSHAIRHVVDFLISAGMPEPGWCFLSRSIDDISGLLLHKPCRQWKIQS